MSGVAGLRGTGDWSTDERPKSFREKILFFSPNGNSPVFGLTSKAGKHSVTDPEFSWWAEGQNLTRLVVNGQLAAGDTLITVVGTDPSAGALGALYGAATNLKPGDILMSEPAADAAAYTPEILEVDTVVSDTQFTARRGAAGTTAATILTAAGLTLIGSAYAEGTGAPRAVSRNPSKFYNFVQIFKDSYELTGTAAHTEARTGDPWSNDKKRKMFDHARGIEMAFFFGRRAEVTGDNGKPKRFMGGFREILPATNQFVFGAPATSSTFSDAIAPAWNFDIGGGDTRIGFCGNFARTEIGKIVTSSTGIKIELGNIVKVYGIDFQEFILPMGRLLLKTHPLLSQHPLYKKGLFVLDFSGIKYVTQKGRPDAKVLDDVQTKDEDVRRGYIQTDCSLMVDGGGLSQAYVGNISAS